MIHQNWDFLGKIQTTEFLHKKHLMCGYRHPKNLRDTLMRANIPAKSGDEEADPHHLLLYAVVEESTVVRETTATNPTGQKSILDFFKPTSDGNDPSTSGANPITTVQEQTLPCTPVMQFTPKPDPGPSKFRGFNFCNRRDCRYCLLLNKSGKITCSITGLEHTCMKNIS
jgi:hypothetical protein